MITRRGAMAVGAIGLAILAGGCDPFGGGASYRFRMTVEVATPQGTKTGSGVMEAFASKIIALDVRESGGLQGEAIVIDLPQGPVFALLKTNTANVTLDGVVTRALTGGAQANFDSYVARVRSIGGWFASPRKAELPREDWPMMVRFRDIRDPKSVEPVDPAAIGVTRITVETTRDDVTMELRRRLTWLRDGGLTLDPAGGPTTNPTFPQTIYQREFTTEIER